MARSLITADDVMATSPGGVVTVSADTLITPLARDVAKDRGITFSRRDQSELAATPASPVPSGTDDPLEERIRRIVASVLGASGSSPPARPPVKLARGSDVVMERFPHAGPGPDQHVAVGDVVTDADGSPMGAGYMSITRGSFPWTFDYDEIQVVLEGELHLGADGGDQVARAGDMFYIPKGSTVTFSTPTWARFTYITFPANWGG